tara:strand:+ start:677 stop:1477 length:801 start_codon:yes stop_codon:yes gene_type:complete
MKQTYFYLFFIFLFFISTSIAQVPNRVEVSGQIFFNLAEKDGITVYNLSSNKGTITDSDGQFKITVAEKDVLEFSSLLIQSKKVIVSEKDIKNKSIKVFLVELVNNLDEVVVLEDGLSGDLNKDVDDVKVFNTNIDVSLGSIDMDEDQFSADYKTAADNIITRQGQYYNMADGMAIVRLVAGLFKNDKKELEKRVLAQEQRIKALKLTDKYSNTYYIENFNIPADKVQAFIAFAEENLDQNLLLKGKELDLIEYLNTQSTIFLEKP